MAEDPERFARHEARRAERDRLVQEEDERRREERKARHAEREARRAEEDRVAQDDEAKAAERRERRRQRDQARMEDDAAAAAAGARPRGERRRSHHPDDDEARRIRHEERRMRHEAADKERPRHSRRRSERPAPVDGYFDTRNGEHPPYGDDAPDGGAPPPTVKTGKDKTASWVHSVSSDPPPPPPVEGTIIDAPVHFAADNTPDGNIMDEDLTARELRHSRRKAMGRHRDLDGYSTEDPERRRGGAPGGRGSRGGAVNSMGYDSMDGVKTFDGRPAMPGRGESKAGSWLKKITGL